MFRRGFITISDGHQRPDETPLASLCAAYQVAREKGIAVVIAGDWFDFLIHGWRAYVDSPLVRQLRPIMARVPTVVLVGNHEGKLWWLERVLSGCNVRIRQHLDVTVNGRAHHIEHGDRFAMDWSWLRPAYQWVAEAAMEICPGQWERFCRRWSPKAAMGKGETQKYTQLTGLCWSNAIQYGMKHETNVIHGHTHTTADIQVGYQVLDCGDARDGSAVLVGPDGQGTVIWL